jgi:hypothetical protein
MIQFFLFLIPATTPTFASNPSHLFGLSKFINFRDKSAIGVIKMTFVTAAAWGQKQTLK